MDYFSSFSGLIKMVDTVHVRLQLPYELKDLAEPLFADDYNNSYKLRHKPEVPPMYAYYAFDDISYGELQFEHELIKLGIPCNINKDDGYDTEGGNKYIRFSPEGELIKTEVADRDTAISLYTLNQYIDNPAAMVQYIKDRTIQIIEPSWINQISYGKIHRLRLLVNAN